MFHDVDDDPRKYPKYRFLVTSNGKNVGVCSEFDTSIALCSRLLQLAHRDWAYRGVPR
jgi:hypothetical protein